MLILYLSSICGQSNNIIVRVEVAQLNVVPRVELEPERVPTLSRHLHVIWWSVQPLISLGDFFHVFKFSFVFVHMGGRASRASAYRRHIFSSLVCSPDKMHREQRVSSESPGFISEDLCSYQQHGSYALGTEGVFDTLSNTNRSRLAISVGGLVNWEGVLILDVRPTHVGRAIDFASPLLRDNSRDS